jgi:hypothetical protein
VAPGGPRQRRCSRARPRRPRRCHGKRSRAGRQPAGWRSGRVRPGRSPVREPPGGREAVLARPRPGRNGDPVLGRLRPDPPVGRRCRIKTLRSHLSPADLGRLAASGAVPAGPSPLPPAAGGQAVEVERPASRSGLVSLGRHHLLAAEILAGRLVGIRVEPPP